MGLVTGKTNMPDNGRQGQDRGSRLARQACLGSNRVGREDGAWGDPLQRKKCNTVRVYLQNIGRLPVEDAGEEKYTHLRHFVTKHSIDLLALPECSVNWGEMEYKQQPTRMHKGVVGKCSVGNGT